MTPLSRRIAALAVTASIDAVEPRSPAVELANSSWVRAALPFTAASTPTFGSVTKSASAGFAAPLLYATCVPVFMTTERIAVPVGSAACTCFRHTWLKRLSPRRSWPLSSSFPECISVLSGSATVIEVAFMPDSGPRENHLRGGQPQPRKRRRKQTRIAFKQVSCTFRNACLAGLTRTFGPSERAHCNSNYAAGNIVEPTGFSCIATTLRKKKPTEVAPLVAPHFRASVAPEFGAIRIKCCEQRPLSLMGRASHL